MLLGGWRHDVLLSCGKGSPPPRSFTPPLSLPLNCLVFCFPWECCLYWICYTTTNANT